MGISFPSSDWLRAFERKLNSDSQYAQIARNWEGDIVFVIQQVNDGDDQVIYHMDLWHGKCRAAQEIMDPKTLVDPKPAYVLTAPLSVFNRILSGQLDPMQAMVTRKLRVDGSMAYMLRNIPVVLDFVRCARQVTAIAS